MKFLFLLLLVLSSLIHAMEVAIVKSVDGEASAKLDSNIIQLKSGDSLSEKMIIQTKSNSGITITFKDGSVLILGSNSIMNLKKYVYKPAEKEYDFKLYLQQGAASFESGKIGELSPESFIFQTPEGTVAIRGTKFLVNVK